MTETSITPAIKAEIISESMPYIRRFHGKTIAMIDEQLQKSFAHDVALLKLIGLNPIVVHGGGPQIDKALKRLGKEGTFLQGMRVTDADTMEVVEWVLGGQVQQDIVMMINQAGGKAVGLTGNDGGLIKAKKKLMDNLQDNPLDIGFVGDVQSIDPSVIKVLQNDQFIPVISPIAYNEEDDAVYNINADIVAGRIAQVMMAEKLVLLTDIRGVLDKEKQLIKRLNTKSINELIEDGTISGGMLPKLTGALEAANAGVNSVHIIDGRVPHSLLLEILTNDGVGSMITV